MRLLARGIVGTIDLRIEGAEHVPRSGPALLICRHYHHLYDGAALLLAVARPVRILVGLDWATDARTRTVMEALCRWAGWPIVLRAGERDPGLRRRYAKTALARSADLLGRGEIIAFFPEGYPTIDPHAPPKPAEWLPFRGGYLTVAERARRSGLTVPLVPAGLVYTGAPDKPTGITIRFGAAETIASASERERIAGSLEARVHALSQ